MCIPKRTWHMSVQRKKRMVGYFYLDKTGLPPQDIPHCPPCEYLIDNPLPARVAHVGRTDADGAVTHSWSRNLDPAAGEDINNNTAAARHGANAIIDGTNFSTFLLMRHWQSQRNNKT